MKGIIYIVVLICTVTSTISQAQNTTKDLSNDSHKEIEIRNWRIDVDYMNPMQGPGKPLTDAYTLQLHNDSVYSYLPYIGKAYSLAYGSGEALNFNAPIWNYTQKKDKKDRQIIEFETKSDEDTYTYTITIYDDGKARIQIQPTKRQPISFRGKLRSEKRQ